MWQVFLDYGHMPNSHLLHFYGFVVPANPDDSVTVTYTLDPADPFLEQKKALFKENGLVYALIPTVVIDRSPSHAERVCDAFTAACTQDQVRVLCTARPGTRQHHLLPAASRDQHRARAQDRTKQSTASIRARNLGWYATQASTLPACHARALTPRWMTENELAVHRYLYRTADERLKRYPNDVLVDERLLQADEDGEARLSHRRRMAIIVRKVPRALHCDSQGAQAHGLGAVCITERKGDPLATLAPKPREHHRDRRADTKEARTRERRRLGAQAAGAIGARDVTNVTTRLTITIQSFIQIHGHG